MITNDITTWEIKLTDFSTPELIGCTIQANNNYLLGISGNSGEGIYFSNLPIYIQKTIVGPDGKPNLQLLEAHFNGKANQIISEIVRNRKVLDVIVFTDLPYGTQKLAKQAVYQCIENMLFNTFNDRTVQTTMQTTDVTISTPISVITKLSELLGNNGYTSLINSRLHEYEYDEDTKTLSFKGDVYYAHFKSDEILQEVTIGGTSADSLMTRDDVTKIIGEAIAIGKTAILSTPNILEMIETYDSFIKANVTSSNIGNVVDISYTGSDPFYINPNIVETYSFNGTNWLMITSNFLLRQTINFFNGTIIDIEENKATKDELNSATTLDDTELLALESVVI